MASDNVTVADICARMRYDSIPKHQTDDELLCLYADRIEAAHNRECVELAEHSLRCGDCARFGRDCDAGDVDGREDCLPCKKFVREVGVAKMETTTQESLAVGNAAKMREALGKILWCLEWMFNNTDDKSVQSHLAEPMSLAKSALSEPVRNCDVGTAEEQAKRMSEWCNGRHCSNCQFRGGWIDECKLRWAQMPYEEGATDEDK